MFRTSNPAQNANVFGAAQTWADLEARGVDAPASAQRAEVKPGVMTLRGTINRTFMLLAACAIAAILVWELVSPADPSQARISPFIPLFGGLVGGLILALVTIFKPRLAPFTAPAYAIFEGALLGALSAMFATMFGTTEGGELTPNYAMIGQAVLLTFGVMATMLIAYSTGIIKPTEKFRAGVVAATGGILVVYIISMVMNLFGSGMPYIHDSGMIGIGFSLFVIAIAALNLVLDFDFIAQGVKAEAPKHLEWYGGFTLLVTLVWLYIEILHLLAKLQSRN